MNKLLEKISWGLLAFFYVWIVVHAASLPFSWGDIFWQIKIGEWVWQHGAVPWLDTWAFTAVGKEWVEQEWLLGMVYYGLESLGGLLALRLFFTVMWVLFLTACFVFIKRLLKKPLWIGLGMLALLPFFQRQFVPAPSTVSLFLFFGLVYLVIWADKKREWWLGLVLTLIFYLWCCMHAQALLFLGFLFIYALFPYVMRSTLPMANKRWRLLLLAAFFIVSFLTPYGYKVHEYALIGPKIARLVNEWHPLFSVDYVGWSSKVLFVVVFIMTACTAYWRARRQGWRTWLRSDDAMVLLMSLVVFYVILKHSRFIWLGVVPLFYSLPQLASLEIRSFKWQPLLPLAMLATLLLYVTEFGWTMSRGAELFKKDYFRQNLRPRTLPIGAADYLLKNKIPGNIFNHYIWGGYLIWRLDPHYQVFIDGRTVLHGVDLMIEEWKVSHQSPEMQQILDKYDIRTLVVQYDFFTPERAAELGWQLRFQDDASAVYTR